MKSNQLLEVLCSKEDDFYKENDNYVHIKILKSYHLGDEA